MADVTFTCGEATFVLTGSIIYGTDFVPVRCNHQTVETADGALKAYDFGPTVIKGSLLMKGISKVNGTAFRSFIEYTLFYGLNAFSIDALVNQDLGSGPNTALTGVKYDGGRTLEGVLTLVAPGTFNINFPYRFVRP